MASLIDRRKMMQGLLGGKYLPNTYFRVKRDFWFDNPFGTLLADIDWEIYILFQYRNDYSLNIVYLTNNESNVLFASSNSRAVQREAGNKLRLVGLFGSSRWAASANLSDNTAYTIILRDNSFTINGATYSVPLGTKTYDTTRTKMSENVVFAGLRAVQNGSAICDLVPFQKPDGDLCLKDKISGVTIGTASDFEVYEIA